MQIAKYGYNLSYEKNIHLKPSYFPARVVRRMSHLYEVVSEYGVERVQVTGRFKSKTKSLPVVGDFVFLEKPDPNGPSRITELAKRKSVFSRKPAVSGGKKIKNGQVMGGTTEEQVLAANIDMVFIVTDFSNDFNPMRLERYIAVAKTQNIVPIVLINKCELAQNEALQINLVKQIDPSIQVLSISVHAHLGIDVLKAQLKPEKTVAFLGSSGVGKSSIINLLFGESIQQTKNINQNTGKGKHTTTSAELFLHESGYLLIDTPGIRELNLWCDVTDLESVYEDITQLEEECRFNDCHHNKEPGCAIKKALEEGTLNRAHYESYLKLLGEAKHLKHRITARDKYFEKLKKTGRLK